MVQSSISLENEIADKMAKTLAEEIDWELLVDMMCAVGWTKVVIGRLKDRYHSIDIQDWLTNNCKGHYRQRGSIFVFEKVEEAEWFSLRWL
jgi:hypothetical protein